MTANVGRHAGDAIRARAPHVLSVYQETRDTVLEGGIVERDIKDLCARYLAEDRETVAALEDQRLTGRERAALAWADAIAWNSEAADDELWRELHRAFTEPELVELGYSIAIILGQQHWLATHGVTEHA
ncbi:MAG TPA: hypothetical protein VJ741_01870 [Solirubrobacteraceae bacterium]|nr:hypothetical protein [Solirubrobacteraceae bacterium]